MKMEEQNDENGCNALGIRRRIVREEFNYVELRTLMSRRYFCIAMNMKYYPLRRKHNTDIDIFQIDLLYIPPLLTQHYSLTSRIGFRFPRDVVYERLLTVKLSASSTESYRYTETIPISGVTRITSTHYSTICIAGWFEHIVQIECEELSGDQRGEKICIIAYSSDPQT